MSEKELWNRFREAKPKILGAIFDLMAATLRTVDAIELPQLPRMADYAIYGYAIADACGVGGHNFIEAYERNHSSQNASVLETQPLAQAIIAYLDGHEEFSGTADAWLEELDETTFTHKIDKNHPAWPRNASRFGKTLERILPLLTSHGIKKRAIPRGAARIHSLYKNISESADDAVVPSRPGIFSEQLALVESIFGDSQLLSDISTPFDDGTS